MINYRGADLFCLFVMLLTPSLYTQSQSGSQPLKIHSITAAVLSTLALAVVADGFSL